MFFVNPKTILSSYMSNPGGGINNRINLIDNDESTEATITSDGAVLQINFGASIEVGAIRLKTERQGNLEEMVVRSSSDGSSYTDVETFTIDDKEWHCFSFEQLNRRYWRIVFNRDNSADYPIHELQLFEVLADYQDSPKLYDYSLGVFDRYQSSNRRYDQRLITYQSVTYKSELRLVWNRLDQESVDELEEIWEKQIFYLYSRSS